MLFSVIILSYNSARTLDRCLTCVRHALSSMKSSEPSEVFVVENGSKDTSKNILMYHATQGDGLVKPILQEVNTGTTASRNMALKKSTGKYVLVLDSDAYITQEALLSMMDTLIKDDTIGMVVPGLCYADGRFQMSTDVFPTLTRKIQRFFALDSMQKKAGTLVAAEKDVDYAISACWLLSREAVTRVGLFDEAIFYSPEDVDYCIRVWEAGLRIRYVPSIEVTHDAQELSRGFKLSFFHFSHLSGLFYLFKKHDYMFSLTRLHQRLGRNA